MTVKVVARSWRLKYNVDLGEGISERILREACDLTVTPIEPAPDTRIILSPEGMQEFLAATTGDRAYRVVRGTDERTALDLGSAGFQYEANKTTVSQSVDVPRGEILIEAEA